MASSGKNDDGGTLRIGKPNPRLRGLSSIRPDTAGTPVRSVNITEAYAFRTLDDALDADYPGGISAKIDRRKAMILATEVEKQLDNTAIEHGLNRADEIAVLLYLAKKFEAEIKYLSYPRRPSKPRLPDAVTSVLPTQAPKLWAERDPGEKINPSKFTRTVYGEWIGKGLTRRHLLELDEPLYRALSVWEHRHPEDAINELTTVAQAIDEKIERLSLEFTPDELRKLGTALQSRLQRQRSRQKK